MVLSMKLIVLMTDFGTKDTYVAEMKAAIWAIAPEAKILDLTHQIEPQNVKQAAFMLSASFERFPEGSVFVSVVDPSVGTKRQMLAARAANRYFVGPDNGSFAFLNDIHEAEIRKIENSEYFAKSVSSTFHGRDIFSRAAAYLAKGVPISDFGPRIDDFIKPEFSLPRYEDGKLMGEIVYIDDFGNAVTNITKKDFEKLGISVGSILSLQIKPKEFKIRLCNTYGEVPKGEKLTLFGSDDFFEISINQGNAAETLNLRVGDKVSVYPLT